MVVYIVEGIAGGDWLAGVYLRRVDAEAFAAAHPLCRYEVRECEVVVRADSGAFGESSVG